MVASFFLEVVTKFAADCYVIVFVNFIMMTSARRRRGEGGGVRQNSCCCRCRLKKRRLASIWRRGWKIFVAARATSGHTIHHPNVAYSPRLQKTCAHGVTKGSAPFRFAQHQVCTAFAHSTRTRQVHLKKKKKKSPFRSLTKSADYFYLPQ